MKTYTTVQGDMWDGIAFTQLGDVGYTDALMALNPDHLNHYRFPAGVKLLLPETSADESGVSDLPWKKKVGG